MARAKFGLVTVSPGAQEVGELARRCEDAGFSALGIADSQSLFRDCYISLTAAAIRTSTLRLGTTITNAVTRHPAVTASAIATLDELSGGRAFLGFGSGDSSVFTLGEKAITLARLRETVTGLRRLTAGEVWDRDGRHSYVRWAKRPVPVLVAAEGPRTLTASGEVADGCIIGTGLQPEIVADSRERVRAGAVAASRNPDDLDLWLFAKGVLGPSKAEAVAPYKMTLAASGHHAFRVTLDGKHVPPELQDRVRELVRSYTSHQHEVLGATTNAELSDRLGLTEYLTDRFMLAGSPEEVVDQIERAISGGVNQILIAIYFHGELAFDYVARMGKEVLPKFT